MSTERCIVGTDKGEIPRRFPREALHKIVVGQDVEVEIYLRSKPTPSSSSQCSGLPPPTQLMACPASRQELVNTSRGVNSMGYESIEPANSVPYSTLRSLFTTTRGRGIASIAAIGTDDATTTSTRPTCRCTMCLGGTLSLNDLGRGLVLGMLLLVTVISAAAIAFAWVDSNEGLKDHHESKGFVEASPTALAEVGGSVDTSSSPKGWCLPNAMHQMFSGLIHKESDDVMPQGTWEGHNWWYHDSITKCFHIFASIGGSTYGFWEAGILNFSGTTEYVKAAYKDDVCMFYDEHIVEEQTFGDAMCRGTAWAGNITLEESVEYGYGMEAERWSGRIPEGQTSEDWGLPGGTELLIDFQRNPTNEEEVRLLYHRVVAPTRGVLAWAKGDSVAFDMVFTGVEVMSGEEIQALVKVPKVCEVMAGKYHDEEALRNTGGGGRGRRTAMRRSLDVLHPEGPGASSSSPAYDAPEMIEVEDESGANDEATRGMDEVQEEPEQEIGASGDDLEMNLGPIHRLMATLNPIRHDRPTHCG